MNWSKIVLFIFECSLRTHSTYRHKSTILIRYCCCFLSPLQFFRNNSFCNARAHDFCFVLLLASDKVCICTAHTRSQKWVCFIFVFVIRQTFSRQTPSRIGSDLNFSVAVGNEIEFLAEIVFSEVSTFYIFICLFIYLMTMTMMRKQWSVCQDLLTMATPMPDNNKHILICHK